MKKVNSILCAIDLSQHSAQVLAQCFRFVNQLGAERLVVLHTCHSEQLSTSDGPISGPIEECFSDAKLKLEKLIQKQDPIQADISIRVIEGDPVDTILKTVETTETDLIILGTGGKAGINRFLLGSVAENVTRKSTTPVLIVRTQ